MSRYVLTDEETLDIAEIQEYLVLEAGVSIARSVINKIKDDFRLIS